MFDVGFSELLIIAVVALIVLGPERLPKAARFAGLWVRKARAQWYSVKSEFEFELAQEEMKKHLHEVENSIKAPVLALQEDIQQASAEFEKTVSAELSEQSTAEKTTEEKIALSSVETLVRSDTEEYSLYDLNEKMLEQTETQHLEQEADQQILDPSQGKLW
jgi:sec-independent protein translocase protein TatB